MSLIDPDTNRQMVAFDVTVAEKVFISGNLANLSPQERLVYYDKLCKSLGLNPLTRPFEYMELKGKLQLYAKKDCTEQLRNIHKVSVDIIKTEMISEIYIVHAKAYLPSGRFDTSTGAVPVKGKAGEDLANAFMKAETKAKRRVTLSICGLGMLDETELESIDAKQIKRISFEEATKLPQKEDPKPKTTPAPNLTKTFDTPDEDIPLNDDDNSNNPFSYALANVPVSMGLDQKAKDVPFMIAMKIIGEECRAMQVPHLQFVQGNSKYEGFMKALDSKYQSLNFFTALREAWQEFGNVMRFSWEAVDSRILREVGHFLTLVTNQEWKPSNADEEDWLKRFKTVNGMN